MQIVGSKFGSNKQGGFREAFSHTVKQFSSDWRQSLQNADERDDNTIKE